MSQDQMKNQSKHEENLGELSVEELRDRLESARAQEDTLQHLSDLPAHLQYEEYQIWCRNVPSYSSTDIMITKGQTFQVIENGKYWVNIGWGRDRSFDVFGFRKDTAATYVANSECLQPGFNFGTSCIATTNTYYYSSKIGYGSSCQYEPGNWVYTAAETSPIQTAFNDTDFNNTGQHAVKILVWRTVTVYEQLLKAHYEAIRVE